MIEEWEITEAVLMAQGEPDVNDSSEEALGRFALGWSDIAEEAEVLAALVRSDVLRDRFIEVRSAIDGSASRPVNELGSNSLDRMLRRVVNEALLGFQSPRSVTESPPGRTILRAIGRALVERPVLASAFRSGTQAHFNLEPDGPCGSILIEATDPDTPYVILQANPGTTLGTQTLTLLYDDGTSSVAVSEFVPSGSEARIPLQGLGVGSERLTPTMFKVTNTDGPRWSGTIRAESVVRAPRRFKVRLSAPPCVEGGRLIVEAMIPEAMVVEAKDGFMELRMLVGTTDILLSIQNVPAAEGTARFEVETDDLPDGTVYRTEPLSLRFLSPGAPSR